MHPLIAQHRAAIAEICRRHRIRRLDVFGSAARADDFDPTHSDVDILVDLAPDAAPDLAEIDGIQKELERLIGRPVDLLERRSVERSRNYIRRRAILSQVEPIYEA